MNNKVLWETIKWFGFVCFIAALILLLSPSVAAHSSIPWVLYIIGNGIWLSDVLKEKNVPWICLAVTFISLDTLVLCTRIFNFEVLDYIQPLVQLLEKLV